MGNFFIATEFLEGSQDKSIIGIKYGETKPIIDLISIGIVSQADNEDYYYVPKTTTYYAVSKEFNIKEAWNRNDGTKKYPEYWIRENVLKPIYIELNSFENTVIKHIMPSNKISIIKGEYDESNFNYKNFKYLINKYGKTLERISKEISEFCNDPINNTEYEFIVDKEQYKDNDTYNYALRRFRNEDRSNIKMKKQIKCISDIKFYAYFADYDWVAFCSIFGKMKDLPKNFPKYCIDLKQILDEKQLNYKDDLKTHPNYPTHENEHNALDDAKWNKKLHKFLKEIKKYEF